MYAIGVEAGLGLEDGPMAFADVGFGLFEPASEVSKIAEPWLEGRGKGLREIRDAEWDLIADVASCASPCISP